MKEFYQNLQKKRQEKGISLEDIFQKTRLPLPYLKALEDGRLNDLPDGYERIYLRRYVKEIGLDEAEVLHDFDLLTGRLAAPVSIAPVKPKTEKALSLPAGSMARSEGSKPGVTAEAQEFVNNLDLDSIHKYVWIALAFIAVFSAGYFIYQQYEFARSNQQLEIKEITMSEYVENFQQKDSSLMKAVSEADAAEAPLLAPTAAAVAAAATSGAVSVRLLALDSTWVREIRDGRDTTDYILPTGLRRTIEARVSVQLTFGKANGVQVWLNQKNLGVMGAEDEILASLRLTAEGVQSKRLRKMPRTGNQQSE